MYTKRTLFIKRLFVAIGLVSMIVLCVWGFQFTFLSSTYQAKSTVEEFYTLEQEGNFSDSWELFHSAMKERFPKGAYIQDRAHVFLNHFGVDTFSYEVKDVQKVEQWKMTNEMEAFKEVYEIQIVQTYKGKYGNFNLHQLVFAVKEKGEWKIAWDYKQ
ncbi:hypothetical protein FZC66_14570 [Priestia megaterium]|nr:hypothetical protein FZC66_14570 [Priestia megaterium]